MPLFKFKVQFDRMHSEDDAGLGGQTPGSLNLFAQFKREMADIDLPISIEGTVMEDFFDGEAVPTHNDEAVLTHDDYRIVAVLPIEFSDGIDVPGALVMFVNKAQDAYDHGMAGFFNVVGIDAPSGFFLVANDSMTGKAFFTTNIGSEGFSIFNNDAPVPGDDYLQKVGWHWQSYDSDDGPCGPYHCFDDAFECAKANSQTSKPTV